MHLYNYINDSSFLDELIEKIKKQDFCISEKKTEVLIEIYKELSPKVSTLELDFGFIWIFEGKVIFYLKNDFNFDKFSNFFFDLEKDFKIKWRYIEFFDKNTKILEILEKNSLLRSFRNEIFLKENKSKVKGIEEIKINLKEKEFLFFIKKYDPKNVKLILHFSSDKD